MGIFRRKVPINYIPIHPDNVRKKDWVILLEAGTIIGPSADKLRVARATLEKRIVRKYNIFLRIAGSPCGSRTSPVTPPAPLWTRSIRNIHLPIREGDQRICRRSVRDRWYV